MKFFNLKNEIQDLLKEHISSSDMFKKNLIKEYLQVWVLEFLYSQKKYQNLIFYGGSCLKQCFGLPRLSEDLDFLDLEQNIDIEKLAYELEKYFKEKTKINIIAKVQKFRIYLKFPILKNLNLANNSESDLLFIKVEIFKDNNFSKKYDYQTIVRPIFRFNKSLLIKTFDLSTLMSTKIQAILFRQWEKTDKESGKTTIKVKGRDYFDLMWYLQQNIKPNFNCLKNIKNNKEFKEIILEKIKKIDESSIILDIKNFIDDKDFVINLGKNIKQILQNLIKNKI